MMIKTKKEFMKFVRIEQNILEEKLTVKEAMSANSDGALLAEAGSTQEESELLNAILKDHLDYEIVIPTDGGVIFFKNKSEYENWSKNI